MEAYIGQIMMFAFGFPPRGWALCDGQLLPINQNQTLYSILGTTYGGDGRTTFALPDLRGRLPVQENASLPLGSKGGAETVQITVQQMGKHHHSLRGSTSSMSPGAANKVLGTSTGGRGQAIIYEAPPSGPQLVPLVPTSIAHFGSGGGHANMQPTLTVSFCIALQGLFPPRN